jgi:hypothetical protein
LVSPGREDVNVSFEGRQGKKTESALVCVNLCPAIMETGAKTELWLLNCLQYNNPQYNNPQYFREDSFGFPHPLYSTHSKC